MRSHLFALLMICVPASASAQNVRGTIRDAETNRPLTGVFVTLGGNGRARIGALTDSLGRFILYPQVHGTYTLRAELIGHQTVTREVAVSGETAKDVNIVLPVNAIRLSEIAVTRDRKCTNDPVRARLAATVWEEARKALALAAWIDGEAGAQFRIRLATEGLDLRGQSMTFPAWEFDSIQGRRSFQAASADSLLDYGFVHMTNKSAVYYGPDADLLVSPRFTAEHCFSIERSRDRPGLIGLAFEPMSGRRTTGISGALWLDEKSGVLRFINYEYVRLPVRVSPEYAAGRVSVRQLPNGAFIIDSYRIIMPVLEQNSSSRVIRTTGVRERTGQLLDVTLNGKLIELVPRYTVRGVAYDSVVGRPMAKVWLNLPGTPFSAVTDSTGAFILRGVPPGVYTVEFDEPGLRDRAELRPPSFRVDSSHVQVSVGLASRPTLIRSLCPGDRTLSIASRRVRLPPDQLGVVQLTLTNPDGSPWVSPHDQVELSFTVPGRDPLQMRFRGDARGILNACGLPKGIPVNVYVINESSATHTLTVRIPLDGFLRADLVRM